MPHKGFTLIELMVAIAIITILSTIVVANLNEARDKGENATIVKQVREYITAINLTFVPNGNEFPWNGSSNLNQPGCLHDTTGSGSCFYNDSSVPVYPDLTPLGDYIALGARDYMAVIDDEGDRFDSVRYASDGDNFRLWYTLQGEFTDDAECLIDDAEIIAVGAPNFPGVTVCRYESR